MKGRRYAGQLDVVVDRLSGNLVLVERGDTSVPKPGEIVISGEEFTDAIREALRQRAALGFRPFAEP